MGKYNRTTRERENSKTRPANAKTANVQNTHYSLSEKVLEFGPNPMVRLQTWYKNFYVKAI
jgi:hypothetical protein